MKQFLLVPTNTILTEDKYIDLVTALLTNKEFSIKSEIINNICSLDVGETIKFTHSGTAVRLKDKQ